MAGYVLRRLIGVIPVLAGLSLLSFLLLHLVPVDPAEAALNLSNPGASEEAVQALREEMGLHEPILALYGTWLYKAVQLDFGTSLVSHQPVGQELGQYLPATLQLALSALLLLLWGRPGPIHKVSKTNEPQSSQDHRVAEGKQPQTGGFLEWQSTRQSLHSS